LYETFHQLLVTHDRQKIEMLGIALANSGSSGFKEEDRKELFVRFVRELTEQHLRVLLSLVPEPLPFDPNAVSNPSVPPLSAEQLENWRWQCRPRVKASGGDELLAMQMLTAYGLIEDNITSSIEQPKIPSRFVSESQIIDALKRFSKNIEAPTISRTFRLSPLGAAFLKFMGLPKSGVRTFDPSATSPNVPSVQPESLPSQPLTSSRASVIAIHLHQSC
jgi:hypothetical protein